MSQSLQDQLRSIGLATHDQRAVEDQHNSSVRFIRQCPPSSSGQKSPELTHFKCEVGGWCIQELLEFGSNSTSHKDRRPILLWREREFKWIVFPGTSRENSKFFSVKSSVWRFFDESYSFNFKRDGYFCDQPETIDPIGFDPIGSLNDERGKKFRIWARKDRFR